MIKGITKHFMFHILWIYILKFLYLAFLSACFFVLHSHPMVLLRLSVSNFDLFCFQLLYLAYSLRIERGRCVQILSCIMFSLFVSKECSDVQRSMVSLYSVHNRHVLLISSFRIFLLNWFVVITWSWPSTSMSLVPPLISPYFSHWYDRSLSTSISSMLLGIWPCSLFFSYFSVMLWALLFLSPVVSFRKGFFEVCGCL